jgi:transposase-like protein
LAQSLPANFSDLGLLVQQGFHPLSPLQERNRQRAVYYSTFLPILICGPEPLGWAFHLRRKVEVFGIAKQQGTYTPEFRQQIVELVWFGGKYAEPAREFGCTSRSLRQWVKRADGDAGQGDGGLTSEELQEPTLPRGDFLRIQPRPPGGHACLSNRSPR